MAKLNVSTIGIIIILIVVAGGIYLSFTGSIPEIRQEEQKEESIAQPEIKSIAGRVISINIDENSFVVLQPKEEREFTVKLGEGTEFIRLVFPFDLNNPPTDGNFTPEREIVTIEDLRASDQVFVRSNSSIQTGQDIVSPLEIQILP
jgi:hypothetical protein